MLIFTACGQVISTLTPEKLYFSNTDLARDSVVPAGLSIYFANGMNTTEGGAGENLFLIKEAVGSNARGTSSQGVLDQITRYLSITPNDISYKIAYNTKLDVLNDGVAGGARGILFQILSSIAQKLISEQGVDPDKAWAFVWSYVNTSSDQIKQVTAALDLPEILVNLPELVDGIKEAELNTARSISENDVRHEHTEQYLSDLENDIRSIVVAQSQGNILTLLGYNQLLQASNGAKCNFAAVHVANPLGLAITQAVNNADEDLEKLYITFENDKVINAIRDAIGLINDSPPEELPLSDPSSLLQLLPLEANAGQRPEFTTGGCGSDPFGLNHTFNLSYFCLSESKAKILDMIGNAARYLGNHPDPDCGNRVRVGVFIRDAIYTPQALFEGDDNKIYPLQITARIVDRDGQPAFPDGEQPPVYLQIIPSGFVSTSVTTGSTDGLGQFTTSAKIDRDLGQGIVQIAAQLTPLSASTSTLLDSRSSLQTASAPAPASTFVALVDPCNEEDAREILECHRNANTDPNLFSHDGLASMTYAGGDYIYTRTLNGQVELQARHTGPFGIMQQIGIRNGSDVVTFDLTNLALLQGVIRVNRQTVTLNEDQPGIALPSGMVIVHHPDRLTDQLAISDTYSVVTSTGDRFEIGTRRNTLTLTSAIVSQGQVEGILGDADGNRLNDFNPRGGNPLPIQIDFPYTGTDHYNLQDYNDFIQSWQVTGSASLFETPYEEPSTPVFNPWENGLTPEQLQFGFDLYRQAFGDNADPFLAWRFAVDLAAQFPPEDLRDIYQRLVAEGIQAPPPPRDADLNLNGEFDVLEAELWNFDNLLGEIDQAEACAEKGEGYDPARGECIPDEQKCSDISGIFDPPTQQCVTCRNTQGIQGVLDLDWLTDNPFSAAATTSGGELVLLRDPRDYCVDSNGSLERNVFAKEVIASGLDHPWGLLHLGSDYFITTEADGGNLLQITPTGQISTLATGLGHPYGVVIDGNGAGVVATGEGKLLQVDLGTGSVTPIVEGLAPLWDLVYDGVFYVTSDLNGGELLKITPTGQVSPVVLGAVDGKLLSQPRGLDDSNSQGGSDQTLMLLLADSGNRRVVRVTLPAVGQPTGFVAPWDSYTNSPYALGTSPIDYFGTPSYIFSNPNLDGVLLGLTPPPA
jgi:hypothetical protein